MRIFINGKNNICKHQLQAVRIATINIIKIDGYLDLIFVSDRKYSESSLNKTKQKKEIYIKKTMYI